MSFALPVLLDIAAIAVLVFGLYFPRHHRADLIVAFLGVNIGVFAVSAVLATATVSAGLGLGLFGVLSIIRLRSSEISQREVAYYFASLALGLLTGLTSAITPVVIGLVVLVIAALAIGDSRTLFGGYDAQEVHLDRAVADPDELRAVLTDLLGAQVVGVSVIRLDMVNDLTIAQVRIRRGGRSQRRSSQADTAARRATSFVDPLDEGDALALGSRQAEAARQSGATPRQPVDDAAASQMKAGVRARTAQEVA